MVNNRSMRASVQNSCGCQSSPSQNKSILKKLQMIDFAITETVLYLDAYPNSKSALSYYSKLVAEREKLTDSLAGAKYPTTHFDNTSDSWVWTNGPWPWQIDAN